MTRPVAGSKDSAVICLLGPTAAGKTALAVRLARELPADIISVDSAQIYRGMDIGTAKPDAATLAAAPHRLIDIRDPWQSYSAGEFRADAMRAVSDIQAAGRIPLLAGGTMLYFRALFQGLSALPKANAAVRRQLEAEAALRGWTSLHDELARVDPAAAGRIHPNDPQRIQRALEVYRLTGTPISQLQSAPDQAPSWRVLKLVVSPADRAVLHQRIARRCEAMFAAGLVDEVRSLLADPRIDADSPAMRAVGYRQVAEHLAGSTGEGEMQQRVVHATRQLAKRQLTWLRRERDAAWLDPTEPEWQQEALALARRFLNQ